MRSEIEKRLATRMGLRKQYDELRRPGIFDEKGINEFTALSKSLRSQLFVEYAGTDRDIRYLLMVIDKATEQILELKGIKRNDDGRFNPGIFGDTQHGLFTDAHSSLPAEDKAAVESTDRQKTIFDETGEKPPEGKEKGKGKGRKGRVKDDGSTAEPAGPVTTKPLEEVEPPKQEDATTPDAVETSSPEPAPVQASTEGEPLSDFSDEDFEALGDSEELGPKVMSSETPTASA